MGALLGHDVHMARPVFRRSDSRAKERSRRLAGRLEHVDSFVSFDEAWTLSELARLSPVGDVPRRGVNR